MFTILALQIRWRILFQLAIPLINFLVNIFKLSELWLFQSLVPLSAVFALDTESIYPPVHIILNCEIRLLNTMWRLVGNLHPIRIQHGVWSNFISIRPDDCFCRCRYNHVRRRFLILLYIVRLLVIPTRLQVWLSTLQFDLIFTALKRCVLRLKRLFIVASKNIFVELRLTRIDQYLRFNIKRRLLIMIVFLARPTHKSRTFAMNATFQIMVTKVIHATLSVKCLEK